jgi:tetraacyldisaccharide 4'-kinase
LRIAKLIADLDLVKPKFSPVPIIIVGNIRVGGTGKTPIVIALAERLSQLGWKPGIISRGFGSQTLSAPQQVHSDSNPGLVGDEPVLIAKLTHNQFPLWVFQKRKLSIRELLKHSPDVDVIISDDGLQHRGLTRWPAREGGRDIEFVVRDARGEGNHFLLPAGPLRESSDRERDATLFGGDSCGVEVSIGNIDKIYRIAESPDWVIKFPIPNELKSNQKVLEEYQSKSRLLEEEKHSLTNKLKDLELQQQQLEHQIKNAQMREKG